MLKFLSIALVLGLIPIVSCNMAKRSADQNSDKWSIRMSDAVMTRYDTLTQYHGSRESKRWQYDVAMMGGAIDKLGDVDPKYSKYMVDYIDAFVQDDGTILTYSMEKYNIDNINPGKNLITLYKRTGAQKYKNAIDTLVKQMEQHPRTKEGSFWHKKVYPNQVWLDGLYMATPFLAQYAKEFNQPQWFDEVVFQLNTVYNRTLDSITGLCYHAYDESREMKWSNPETGQSPHFWSRSMGWYSMALVDVLEFLPENHPGRDGLITILKNTVDALLKVRDPQTGLWYQVLDQGNRTGNYIEGSGSAMFTYVMAKAANRGWLDKSYLKTANESFDNIVKHLIITDEDGMPSMIQICGACGLGGNPYRDGSYDYYINEKIVTNDTKGVGPFIMAALELGK